MGLLGENRGSSRSGKSFSRRDILDVNDGRAVENIQAGNLNPAALHSQDLEFGNGNGVRAHGAAGGEHTPQSFGFISPWIDLESVSVRLMEPAENHNGLAYGDALQAVLVLGIDLQRPGAVRFGMEFGGILGVMDIAVDLADEMEFWGMHGIEWSLFLGVAPDAVDRVAPRYFNF